MMDGAQNPSYSAQYGSDKVVISQPDKSAFPQNTSNLPAPRGLEYLAQLNQIDIHQILHLEEVLVGWERNNQYQVCNTANQEFLHVKEESDCCSRQWCGNKRPFEINIADMQGSPVIRLARDLHCQGCMCPCSLQEMEIQYPPGQTIATIKEIYTCCIPRYEIYDVNGQVIFKIEGISIAAMWFACCTEIPFKIQDPSGQERGEITKHWGGCREMFGQVNDFSVTYAPNESPINKAILLGATFLVDFMYFEHKKQ